MSIANLFEPNDFLLYVNAESLVIPSLTPSELLATDAMNNIISVPYPSGTNLLPLNNTWTGTNTYTNSVILPTLSPSELVATNGAGVLVSAAFPTNLLTSNNTWTGTNDFTALTTTHGISDLSGIISTGTIIGSNLSGTVSGNNSGDVTLAPVGVSPNVNAAVLIGQSLALQPANAVFPGVITTGSQTISGPKSFTSTIVVPTLNLTTAVHQIQMGNVNPLILDAPTGSQLTVLHIPRNAVSDDVVTTMNSSNILAGNLNLSSLTPSQSLGLDALGNVISTPIVANLLASNNTWTGSNTFDVAISTPAIHAGDGSFANPSYSFQSSSSTGLSESLGTLTLSTEAGAVITYDNSATGNATGFFFCLQTYGYQTYSPSLPTSLSAGSWVSINLALTAGGAASSSNIDVSTPQTIVYNGLNTNMMQASVDVSFNSSALPCNLQIAIFHNGSINETGSIVTMAGLAGGITSNGNTTALLTLSPGDDVEFMIMSDTNTTISVSNFNLRLVNMT